MKSTLCKECGHYMKDIVVFNRTFQLPPKNMIVDGTHSSVECLAKPHIQYPKNQIHDPPF